jgi:hypothetical protein
MRERDDVRTAYRAASQARGSAVIPQRRTTNSRALRSLTRGARPSVAPPVGFTTRNSESFSPNTAPPPFLTLLSSTAAEPSRKTPKPTTGTRRRRRRRRRSCDFVQGSALHTMRSSQRVVATGIANSRLFGFPGARIITVSLLVVVIRLIGLYNYCIRS